MLISSRESPMPRLIPIVALLLFPGNHAAADAVMLAEWGLITSGTRQVPIIQARFLIKAPNSSGTLCSVGLSRAFSDGEVGTYDFFPDDVLETQFECFLENVSDGVDDTIGNWVHLLPNAGGNGIGTAESNVFPTEPDLMGSEIAFMRLVIDSLSIGQTHGFYEYSQRARWQFWGSSPATSVETGVESSSWGQIRSMYRLADTGP